MKTRETLQARLEAEIAATNIEPGIQQILKIALGRIIEYQEGMKDPKADGTYWVGVELEPYQIRGRYAPKVIEFLEYARKHWPVAQQMADMAASANQDVDIDVLTRKLIDGMAERTSQQMLQVRADLLKGELGAIHWLQAMVLEADRDENEIDSNAILDMVDQARKFLKATGSLPEVEPADRLQDGTEPETKPATVTLGASGATASMETKGDPSEEMPEIPSKPPATESIADAAAPTGQPEPEPGGKDTVA